MKKQDARLLASEVQEALRLRVVAYLKRGLGTQVEAASIFQISLSWVQKTWKRYKEGGNKTLRARKRGPKCPQSRLSKAKEKEIRRLIQDSTPDQQRIPRYLWTASAVRELIKKKRSKL